MDRIGILATARRVRSIKAALEHIWEVLSPPVDQAILFPRGLP